LEIVPAWNSRGPRAEAIGHCAAEVLKAEENRRRELEAQERLQKIEKEATELREREVARLARHFALGLDELRRLSPSQFEDQIARMFERLGYEVSQTPYSSDFGRDAILRSNPCARRARHAGQHMPRSVRGRLPRRSPSSFRLWLWRIFI
jgi:hypothetical protein